MISFVQDKVRFVDKFHGAHFVHSLEIGPDYLTFYVMSSFDDRTLQAMIDKDADLIRHDVERFHKDDPECRWIMQNFGYPEKTHFHMRFDHKPTQEEVYAVLECLGMGVSPSMKHEVTTYFNGGE